MPLHDSTLTWTAHTCMFQDAHVFLGLAAGLDATILERSFAPDVLAKHPSRTIPITKLSSKTEMVSLRMYAVRRADVCHVEDIAKPSGIDGFRLVRLHFLLSDGWLRRRQPPFSQIRDAIAPVETPSVVAFLLTHGLTMEAENHFFNHVVGEFLDHSWASFPQLLREIGCVEPSNAA